MEDDWEDNHYQRYGESEAPDQCWDSRMREKFVENSLVVVMLEGWLWMIILILGTISGLELEEGN